MTRNRVVLVAFIAMMSIFGVVFMNGGGQGAPLMVKLAPMESKAGNSLAGDGLQPRQAIQNADRWSSIVIHHSGHPLDDHRSIDRRHREQLNFARLGYHFVIGNGARGLADGEAFVSARWDRQEDGAHLPSNVDVTKSVTNGNSIAICVVGNGDLQTFTPGQVNRLIALVARLQRDFNIPDHQVWPASDLVETMTSPGRYFPLVDFEQRLALED